jgi:hypothetical protein
MKTTVLVQCKAECSTCARTISDARSVSAVEIRMANANVLEHSLTALEGSMKKELEDRGWKETQHGYVCGRCRDKT